MALTSRPQRRRQPAPTNGEVTRRTAVTGRVEIGRTGEARRRNTGWMLAGVLLVLVSAIGGVLLFTSADDRHGVLVAAGDIEVGQPVQRSHLRVVQMSTAGGAATLGTSDVAALIGQIPIGRIPGGTVLNRSMFTTSAALGADEMVFGAALDPGEAPVSSVATGAAVRLLATPRAVAGVGRDRGAPPPADVIGDGIVWDVETLGSGKVWISVRTTVDVGLVASKAAQDDELRVVIVGTAAATTIADDGEGADTASDAGIDGDRDGGTDDVADAAPAGGDVGGPG